MPDKKRPTPPLADILDHGGAPLGRLLDVMPGWVWEVDHDFRFIHVSSNRALIEDGPDDSIGASRLDNFRRMAAGNPAAAQHVDDMLNHRPFRNFVYRLPANDGGTPWICTSGDPRFDDDGVFAGYQGFAMLVTPIMDAAERSIEAERALLRRNALLEERVAERTRELEAANTLLSDIVEGMDHGLICFSGGALEEQRIVLANRRAAEMLEVPPELVRVGALRFDLHRFCEARGDYIDAPPDAVSLLLAPTPESRTTNLVRILPSGRAVHALAQHADNGTIVATYTDVTSHKQRERELDEARAAAVAADDAKSQFLANMSHEIRTPLNGVLGVAALMRTTELDDAQRSYADVIVQSGETLVTILNDILDFSKIEAGQMTLDEAPFSLASTIEDVVTLMRVAAEGKGLTLDAALPANLPDRLLGDMVRLRQVLTNLIGNAVKFTDAGAVRIEVDCVREPTGLDRVEIRVTDTGIGISDEQIDFIFEDFRQVGDSMAHRREGTGLGLAISRKLVGLMGGRIGARSRLGEGTTIWIRIPFFAAAADDTPESRRSAVAGGRR